MTQYICIHNYEDFTLDSSVEEAFEEMQTKYSNVEIDDCEFYELIPLKVEREVMWNIEKKDQ